MTIIEAMKTGTEIRRLAWLNKKYYICVNNDKFLSFDNEQESGQYIMSATDLRAEDWVEKREAREWDLVGGQHSTAVYPELKPGEKVRVREVIE